MKKNIVAIQGELGAYSHIAANEVFKDCEIKTCSSFEEVFRAAFDDDKIKIIIPLENSLAGRVADIHYLLPKYKLQIMPTKKIKVKKPVIKIAVKFLVSIALMFKL